MTSLKEIEARAEQLWRSWITGKIDDELAKYDIRLLIKAVRQLGVIMSEYREVYPSMEMRLDHDVLALLESARR